MRAALARTEIDLGLAALAVSIAVLLLCMVGFAAVAAVLRYRNRRKEREWLAREAKWEGALLDLLAGEAAPEGLHGLVRPGEELYFVDYLLRHARRVRGSTRRALAALARPYLAAIAERTRSGDAERRARAVETLAMLGLEDHLPVVVAALHDPSPLVVMMAARGLARQQRPEHVDLLLDHADRLTGWSPRQLAAVLISMGPQAATALRRTLADRLLPPPLRAVAADALRQLHDPEAAQVALHVLADEGEREVLAACLRLVGELGRPADAAQVWGYACHEDPVVRAAAMQALGAAGNELSHDLLREAIDDPSAWVAIQAARALRRSGGVASLQTLARADTPRSLLARQMLLESA